MKRIFRNESRALLRRARCAVIALLAAGALAQTPLPARAATDCPAPPQNHIPHAAPDEELNIGRIQKLLLDYHQRYYDIDVAAVFDMASRTPPDGKSPRWCSTSTRRR